MKKAISEGQSDDNKNRAKVKSLLKVEDIKETDDMLMRNLSLVHTRLDSVRAELSLTKSQLESTKAELERVYSSREWKLVSVFRKLVKIFFPNGSLRRKAVVSSWRLVKMPLRLTRKTKEKFFFQEKDFSEIDEPSRPKKRRKINTKSKRIVYIGHSYHNKTKSTEFLTDYLKQFYDVEVILDESWQGEPFPDLSFIDESYLGVIFFQNLPNQEILKKIKNDNLIFFPMYDSVGLDYAFWNNYKNLKIINFSETLHEKLAEWGFDSMYVQYFPDFQKFISGNGDEVFFWQRITKMNINTIAKLFEKDNLKIHIHKAIDPEHQFVQPSKGDEKKFQITYSDWFETRDEMWDLIKQKGIYIAPREFEGIGLSFLEAMAMGKAVIAVNNPTMNEYIKHGKTGYLFNLSNPQKIDLSNLKQVQNNVYSFMLEGRKKWEKEKHRIIDFIKMNHSEIYEQRELPMINVITVAYNVKNDLEKTIRSVVKQDYSRINYIIIDGGSTDGTSEMVKKYKDKINLYISEKDKGIYDAMNKGISKVEEGYINFLNAGDEYISTRTISEVFENIRDKYDLVYGKIVVGEVTDEKLKNPQKNINFTKNNLLLYNSATLCHQAMFLKKEKTPLYDESYRIKGDLDWYFEIIDRNPSLSYYRSDVVVTNYKGGGMSEKRYFLDIYEVSKLILKRFGIASFFKYKYHSLVLERIFRENKNYIKSIFS